MNFRGMILFRMHLISIKNRVRYDLIREIVVAFSSLILLLLFGYMFQDFINVKLASLTEQMQQSFAKGFSIFVFTLCGIYLWRVYGRWSSEFESIENTGFRLGESKTNLIAFQFLKITTSQILLFGSLWTLVHKYIYQFNLSFAVALQLALSLGSISGLKIGKFTSSHDRYYLFSYNVSSRMLTLLKWRMIQMLFRHRLSQACIALWILVLGMVTIIGLNQSPFSMAVIFSIIGSILLSGPLIFQLQEDMEHSWLEKNLGISQQEFCRVYLLCGLLIGGAGGLLATSAHSLPLLLQGGSWDWTHLKILVIHLIGPLSLAPLMFQIDPHRPLVQFLNCFFVCLFLGTGIFAHIAVAILFPFLIHYGLKYQQNNYYHS